MSDETPMYAEDEIIRLFEEGYSIQEIAKKTGLSMSYVYEVITSHINKLYPDPK